MWMMSVTAGVLLAVLVALVLVLLRADEPGRRTSVDALYLPGVAMLGVGAATLVAGGPVGPVLILLGGVLVVGALWRMGEVGHRH